MKVLIVGICGFVGSTLARGLVEHVEGIELLGLDNLVRPGSERNRAQLRQLGIRFFHGDIRCASDFDALPAVEWVIDAAANPSVLAGVDGQVSSRQLVEHNLLGTVNLLEYCKARHSGFLLLSTSRVYSIEALTRLELEVVAEAYRPKATSTVPGLSERGISEAFSTTPPISLYGSTKLASETLALEYGSTFELPIWINRCGVLAGGGQFGRPDQGIFSFWVHAYRQRRSLKYFGFDGRGFQVRDCLHPRDLVGLVAQQMRTEGSSRPRIVNLGGGVDRAMSLAQLSGWCADRFGPHDIAAAAVDRPFDIPWMVMCSDLAQQAWGWRPTTSLDEILDEIAEHAEQHPEWLDISTPT
ncbi:MAG: NAD-dependent epimerase/dehydratase family protein [Acidobacteriota bacterium]